MSLRPFQQVDVFTQLAFKGNPLAVVLDAQGLSDAVMQQFAQWTQLSETTFVLPPTPHGLAAGADYRVRIFTPGMELPFAGHPTLGTADAWLRHGGQPRKPGCLVQECGVGLVTLSQQSGHWAFAAPALQRQAPTPQDLQPILDALGLSLPCVLAAQYLDNGPQWLGLLLDDLQTLRRLSPDHAQLKALGMKVGVAAKQDAARLEVRAFAAPAGIQEDPVTGSLNASLAQWLMAEGWMPDSYQAHQGAALGRDGRVFLSRDAQDQVWVGGHVVPCIQGMVDL